MSRRSVDRVPLLWRLETESQAVALRVDVARRRVWAANDAGAVYEIAGDGSVLKQLKVPAAVQCMTADPAWTAAACNDGKIYDVAGVAPRVLIDLGPQMAFGWIEAYRGKLLVADLEGGLSVFDVEKNLLWERRDDDASDGWLARADERGVYHGSRAGVRGYDWSGKLRFTLAVGDVRYGVLDGDTIVVTAGFATGKKTRLVALTTAGVERFRVGLNPSGHHRGAESCAVSRDAFGHRLFASCGDTLFCFAGDGRPLWRAPTGCGSACSMAAVDGLLYVATDEGAIACLDVRAV